MTGWCVRVVCLGHGSSRCNPSAIATPATHTHTHTHTHTIGVYIRLHMSTYPCFTYSMGIFQVQKLSYDDGRILLKRSCATKCTHGCFRVITQERCEDCCNTPLCNTGNGARHVTESAWLVSVGSTLFACCLAYIVIPWRTP